MRSLAPIKVSAPDVLRQRLRAAIRFGELPPDLQLGAVEEGGSVVTGEQARAVLQNAAGENMLGAVRPRISEGARAFLVLA
jgi:hypothetical protein